MAVLASWEDVARRVGAQLTATLRAEPVVEALWASPDYEELLLWLVIAPTEGAVALRIQAAVNAQLRQFHEADVRLFVLNRRNYPNFDPDLTLPEGALLLTRFADTE